jgi:hypothetical protein
VKLELGRVSGRKPPFKYAAYTRVGKAPGSLNEGWLKWAVGHSGPFKSSSDAA